MNEKTVEIALSEIMIDPVIMTRPVNDEWVQHLIEGVGMGVKPDPMLVTKFGKQYVLVGGQHRYRMWQRVLGEKAEALCRIAECKDVDDAIWLATIDNLRNARPLTPFEQLRQYERLTKERGWPKRKAREALGISDAHGDQLDTRLVRMEADPPEPTRPEERANPLESPDPPERARLQETPGTTERANRDESTAKRERATPSEATSNHERAMGSESPMRQERATDGEPTIVSERPTFPMIRFHFSRLSLLVPKDWTEARRLLIELGKEIESHTS